MLLNFEGWSVTKLAIILSWFKVLWYPTITYLYYGTDITLFRLCQVLSQILGLVTTRQLQPRGCQPQLHLSNLWHALYFTNKYYCYKHGQPAIHLYTPWFQHYKTLIHVYIHKRGSWNLSLQKNSRKLYSKAFLTALMSNILYIMYSSNSKSSSQTL